MQHNRAGRKLGRTTAHRKSLFRNQLSSLITHERIQTTLPKAKDLRPLIEKMVTLGKRGGLHARRLALKTIPEAMTVKKLFEELRGEEVEHQALVKEQLVQQPPDDGLDPEEFVDEPQGM